MSIYKHGFVPRALARNSDPHTSHEAARHVVQSGKHGEQMDEVRRLVREHPGHTALELTKYTTLDRYQIQRRLSDLSRLGEIRANPTPRKCTVGGRLSCTWDVM